MLRPTFLAFETAKRALNTSQRGLDTVGHNIANAKTPGYTRQRVDQVSISSGGYGAKYQIRGAGNQFSGQGSLISGISQVRDPFLDTRYRNEAPKYGEQATKLTGLTELEDVLDEVMKGGISDQLTKFIGELTKFALGADSNELATVVRNSAVQLVQLIKKSASELSEVMSTKKADMETIISTDVNIVLQQIASLNRIIREDNINGNPSLELNDTRNMLIDQLSEYLPIRVVRTPEKISEGLTIQNISIMLVDYSSSPPVDVPLVQGSDYKQLDYGENPDGTVRITLQDGHNSRDLTSSITSGALKGFIDLINGAGEYAGANGNHFRGILYYQRSLDTFARTFAEMMNRQNSIWPADIPPGSTNTQPFFDKNLFATTDGSGQITASNLMVSDEWMRDVRFFTTAKGDPVIMKPDLDQNGQPKFDLNGDPVYIATANPDNINKFIAMLQGHSHFSGHSFSGSFSGFLLSIQSDLSLDKQLTNTLFNASDTVLGGFADQRDAISAVSIDEEAMNMMIYQNYYNAAARFMTTLDEALGTIIQGMGVVGR